ncbi:hypothetical protein B11107_16440 [Campylobacter jejuni]|nr:hypothetical protein THJ037_16490 [Campylobacter jejuni]BDL94430.1 hypothetical protein THJ057_16490 [Campylobacter jejuni]BDM16556.1 hypothetical protein THJ111_16490 [Campylobacter jejuni]BDM18260.1 hypothetical protein THJ112_16450 [Campylobacter jejuni]BEK21688.1 hypothetical protein B11107_16440 [Campylobacter jejuni]
MSDERCLQILGGITAILYVRIAITWIKIYLIIARNEYKCNECQKRFSVTNGTLFHAHKLPLQMLLSTIVLFVNAIKDIFSTSTRLT